MSRVAKKPVSVPSNVVLTISGGNITVKGPKGEVSALLHAGVEIKRNEQEELVFEPNGEVDGADAMAGTTRALVYSMVEGVVKGFEKGLTLVGVGYKAQMKGRDLELALGYSHPIVYRAPAGITIETPSQTEIVVKGADKRLVGQVAADIRAFRAPEPYKCKGIRYHGEVIVQKEGKKK